MSTRSRWLRLLFTREFSLPDAMMIWDGLFATETPFKLARWVCVVMLIRIRNQRTYIREKTNVNFLQIRNSNERSYTL